MSGTAVRIFRSTDTNSPSLTGQASSLLNIFDACLVNGVNIKTVSSITRVGQVATVSFATAHGYAADGLSVINLSGADQSEYNGDFSISNVLSLSFSITVTGSPATPATGTTISCKQAPLGWGKPFANSGDKGVYRSSEGAGTRMFLRVDDSNPQANSYCTANLRGYETMTDVNTGVGLFPTVVQMTTGIFLNKSNTTDGLAYAQKWVLVGDGYEFLFFYNNFTSYNNIYRCFHFGDIASEMASDPYGCLIYGDNSASPTGAMESATVFWSFISGLTTVQIAHYMARGYAQTGGSVNVGKLSDGNLAVTAVFGWGGMPYPAPHNNGLYIVPIYVGDPATILRGTLKCIYNPLHTRPLGHGNIVSGLSNLPGRTLYAIATPYTTAPNCGETHVDITGPWR